MAPEKEKALKTKGSQIKHVPKDAQVIMSILKELGVQDYEPRVINQLLEFTYRYVTCILDDAKVFANHSRKKMIDLDDVKLATEAVLDKAFTSPPNRHIVAKLAEVRNAMPLPPTKAHCGLRLPPDRYCHSACNYKLRPLNQSKKMTKSAVEGGRSSVKLNIKSNANQTTKRQSAAAQKSQLVSIPKPVFKFTATPKIVPVDQKPSVPADLQDAVKMEIDGGDADGTTSRKREREDDDFEKV